MSENIEEFFHRKTAGSPLEVPGLLLVPISAGELIDKITILTIKTQKMRSLQKRLAAKTELALLEQTAAPLLNDGGDLAASIAPLMQRLAAVNFALWEVEDELRTKEKAQEFDARFIEMARSVYRINDERARLKSAINAAANSQIVEVKEHPEY